VRSVGDNASARLAAPRPIGARAWGGSIVGLVAHKRRSLDAHEQTGFVNDRVKDLFGGHAPGEECGDAPKCGLLGLDFREMRINSGA